MADSHVTLTVRFADVEQFRLLVWELRMLSDEMRVSADPYAERLEHALDRFTEPMEDGDA
jgi:hypothetical protein